MYICDNPLVYDIFFIGAKTHLVGSQKIKNLCVRLFTSELVEIHNTEQK